MKDACYTGVGVTLQPCKELVGFGEAGSQLDGFESFVLSGRWAGDSLSQV